MNSRKVLDDEKGSTHFFVRKRVRTRVEKEADGEGKLLITIAEVKAAQTRFLSRMESDIKGYQIETCFGAGGCPNACSQPQIKDIGIIGACVPEITQIPCSRCEACIDVCREQAISLKTAFRFIARTARAANVLPIYSRTRHLKKKLMHLEKEYKTVIGLDWKPPRKTAQEAICHDKRS